MVIGGWDNGESTIDSNDELVVFNKNDGEGSDDWLGDCEFKGDDYGPGMRIGFVWQSKVFAN